jgi:hypothetical protein
MTDEPETNQPEPDELRQAASLAAIVSTMPPIHFRMDGRSIALLVAMIELSLTHLDVDHHTYQDGRALADQFLATLPATAAAMIHRPDSRRNFAPRKPR